MAINPDALLIQLNQPYGPFPSSFRHILKEGYSVFVGKNDAGKSSFLQRIFVHFCQRGDFGRQSVCYIGPDRQYVKSQSPPPVSLDQYNNELLGQISQSPRVLMQLGGLTTVCSTQFVCIEQTLWSRSMLSIVCWGEWALMAWFCVKCRLSILMGLISTCTAQECGAFAHTRGREVSLTNYLLVSAGAADAGFRACAQCCSGL